MKENVGEELVSLPQFICQINQLLHYIKLHFHGNSRQRISAIISQFSKKISIEH